MSAISPAVVFASAAVGAAILIALEVGRGDVRNRAARVVATLAAVLALSLLGICRGALDGPPREPIAEAVLWTHHADPEQIERRRVGTQFSLPGVTQAPPGAMAVPDVAYIRRSLPALRKLHVIGEGLEPFEIETLTGVELNFEPSRNAPSAPAISFLHVPRELVLGAPLRVQGRIDGPRAGEPIKLALTAPDGAKTEATVATSGSSEGTTFELVAAPAQSAGRFLWQLSARNSSGATVVDETIGVAIVRPVLPRVLVLESSPRLDTAHLRRWFVEMGGMLVSRTNVARDRYRFAASDDAGAEFDRITRELLARFDVVIGDVAALGALPPEERSAIDEAVREEGLGVLAVNAGGDATEGDERSLVPWRLEPVGEMAADDDARTARLVWPSLSAPLEQPIAVDNLRLALVPGRQTLVTDGHQRSIAAAVQRGRGRLAISLARDTWAWRLREQPAAFAIYWSYLLDEVAKPLERQAHRWAIENAASEPLFVNRPVQLRLTGPAEMPTGARAISELAAEQIRLPLGEDPAEPHQWRTTFWPQRAGWHKVQLGADGAQIEFFVHEANAWSSLAPARRTRAMQLAAAQPREPSPSDIRQPERVSVAASAAAMIALYALLLASASYLWLERRRAA